LIGGDSVGADLRVDGEEVLFFLEGLEPGVYSEGEECDTGNDDEPGMDVQGYA